MRYTTTEKEGIVTYKCIPDGYNGMYFYCPYCEKFHSHGTTDDFKSTLKASHRVEHCIGNYIPGTRFTERRKEKNHPKGYYVKRFTNDELKEMKKDIDDYFKNLPDTDNRYNIGIIKG